VPLQQVDRTYVRFGRRKLSYFSGCDYFRLASHPKVQAALRSGLKQYGLNVAASRLTTGNHVLYRRLETELAAYFGTESALLISTGYLANLVVAQGLAGNFSHVVMDEAAHPSLVDAAAFFDCPILRFKSRDVEDAARTARRCGPGARLILLTDGMFSRDGSAAPLREYLKVLPRDTWLLVDDAHGGGVVGKTGRGTPEHAGVDRRRLIQTFTLSKAFGVYGGGIVCNSAVRQRIIDRSKMFVGSTPLPLPLTNAALCAVRILKSDSGLRRRLNHNSEYIKTSLRKAGLAVPEAPGPIVCLPEMRPPAVRKLKAALLSAGIYPPFLKYPGGPTSGYFRFVISSEHTRKQLDALLRVLTAGGQLAL
jgi:7-keto-8-aminopelargonate synthetase-like enzyme